MIPGLEVHVHNKPLPQRPACCQLEGCTIEPKRFYQRRWMCLWHFYRLLRDALPDENEFDPEEAA